MGAAHRGHQPNSDPEHWRSSAGVRSPETQAFCRGISVDPTQYWTQSQTDTYIRAWKEKHGDREVVRPVLLPNLEYLYFNNQAAGDEISVLTTARQAMGRPFKTAYTPDVHLKTIPAEELEKIRDSVGELEIMDGMKPPPVELDIHRGMADTVDKSV